VPDNNRLTSRYRAEGNDMRFYTSRFVVSAPYFARVLFNANVFLYGESIYKDTWDR